MKEENILRNSRFFWGTENTSFPAAVVHSHLLNTSLKTAQSLDRATDASLACFALPYFFTNTPGSLHSYTCLQQQSIHLCLLCSYNVRISERNLFFLNFPIISVAPLCFIGTGYLLKAPKLELFRTFIFKRFSPACAKCKCTLWE